MNLKKIGKLFTSKPVANGSPSYKKRIYRAAVSQRLRNTGFQSVKIPEAVIIQYVLLKMSKVLL